MNTQRSSRAPPVTARNARISSPKTSVSSALFGYMER